MPITLHDFTKNFVVKSNGLTGFGRVCSAVGLTQGKEKIHGKLDKKRV